MYLLTIGNFSKPYNACKSTALSEHLRGIYANSINLYKTTASVDLEHFLRINAK